MSLHQDIANKIKSLPSGEPICPAQFQVLGTRAAIDKALSRLAKEGMIERLQRGIYVKPKQGRRVGKVLPRPEEVAHALARQKGEILQVHGAEAARRFGFSTQVPSRTIFYTSGPTRCIRVGKAIAELRHASPRKLHLAGRPAGAALSALWYLGAGGTTIEAIEQIRRKLPPDEFAALAAARVQMPAWMNQAFADYERARDYAGSVSQSAA